MENQEIEIKFYVQDLSAVEGRLLDAGAVLVQERTFEMNLRFDTPTLELAKSYRVLRLRRDTDSRMTYKGPGVSQDGIKTREEIEFSVADFDKARQLLEALGYHVAMAYEKYRRIYDLANAHIALDEMPYGNFVEIESPSVETIQNIGFTLGLKREASVSFSYATLFEQLQTKMKLDFRDLSFSNFSGLVISAQDLEVEPADK